MDGTGQGDARGYRLASIDLVRGIAIVVMALDHTRDFFSSAHLDIFDPSRGPLALFLTRWVTHLCAPAFVFLAGVSAGLMARRRPRGELSLFLLKRGVWLLLLEMSLITFAWTFGGFGGGAVAGPVFIMQVIWAIGAAMVVMAALVWLPHGLLLAAGLAIVAGHNLLDGLWPASTFPQAPAPFWHVLHNQALVLAGVGTFFFAYPLLAWVGVMAAGFGAAGVFLRPEAERHGRLLLAGAAMVGAFLALRALNGYGEPNGFAPVAGSWQGTFIDFLNVTKYPPSLQYLLMTLGPTCLLLAAAERWRGRFAGVLVTFGRVPFLFYVAHLYLLHAGAVALGMAQGFGAARLLVDFTSFPPGYGIGLPGVYAVWLGIVALLYFPCAWFAGVKKRRRDWWLSYL
jgi:uncharacterized membrane protein